MCDKTMENFLLIHVVCLQILNCILYGLVLHQNCTNLIYFIAYFNDHIEFVQTGLYYISEIDSLQNTLVKIGYHRHFVLNIPKTFDDKIFSDKLKIYGPE